MKYLSVCSGIEAATAAWHPLGWEPVAFAEIEKFPSAVLAHHYPDTPNWGDLTRFKEWPDATVDVLVGGTPCQSFSVAGLRKGLDDPRGNLALTFLALAERYRPIWIVWENVPGVLSSSGGRDFGSFLGGLVELGYGFAYRVLDAQYFGVAQRRRRVFVVGHLGDWRRAAAVLFEPESLRGDSPPSREKGEGFTHDVAPSIGASGRGFDRAGETRGQDPVIASDGDGACPVAHSLRAEGFDASEDGTGRGTPLVPVHCDSVAPTLTSGPSSPASHGKKSGTDREALVAFSCKDHGADASDIAPTLRSMGHDGSHANGGGQLAVAFAQNQRDEVRTMEVAGALASEPGMKQQTYIAALAIRGRGDGRDLEANEDGVANALLTPNGGRDGIGPGAICADMQVRRLTPVECERLQGFPDGYTAIPYRKKTAEQCADGPRYKALGNSMAVPVMHWIGKRIKEQA